MSLPKPVMRGLLAKRLRFHLPIAFSLSLVAAIAFKVTERIHESKTLPDITCHRASTWTRNLSWNVKKRDFFNSTQWRSPGNRHMLTSTNSMILSRSSMPWRKLVSLRVYGPPASETSECFCRNIFREDLSNIQILSPINPVFFLSSDLLPLHPFLVWEWISLSLPLDTIYWSGVICNMLFCSSK